MSTIHSPDASEGHHMTSVDSSGLQFVRTLFDETQESATDHVVQGNRGTLQEVPCTNEEESMASIAGPQAPEFKSACVTAAEECHSFQVHVISPEAGHALEILGHAIEYLADELVHEHRAAEAERGRVDAIQILMACNRQIYFASPLRHSLGERLRELASRLLTLH